MDIIKLYKANWKKSVFVTSSNKNEEKIFTYYLIYRRPNHVANANLNTNSLYNHSDEIDDEIVQKLDDFFNGNVVTEFESTLSEFKPWNNFKEIEKARISKIAYGHDCADVVINTNNLHAICRLKARINCFNYADVNNHINILVPNILNLNVEGRIESLVAEEYMNRMTASETVTRYFGE
jgi:hypothetical protein